MGIVNILNASVNGKLGQLYGAKQYGNYYLKAVPFSHSPHNEKQKQSFSAFQKLVRFSSGIAKDFKKFLPIDTKTMTSANATAKLFKPIVKDKTFEVSYLKDVIAIDNTTKINSFKINYETSQAFVDAATTSEVNPNQLSNWILSIFDDTGKIIKNIIPNKKTFNGFIPIKTELERNYGIVSFRSDKLNKKQLLHGLDLRVLNYIVNGYLNIDAFPTKENYSVSNDYLVINDETVSVSEDYLKINL